MGNIRYKGLQLLPFLVHPAAVLLHDLIKPERLALKLHEIASTGFSTFFSDVAMGILTVLFNRQIMKYLGSDALAIYGPIIQVSTFVQCCAYSVGQAAQP